MSNYPSFNDREFDLLRKIASALADIATNGGGGGGGGAVSSVFGRAGAVIADPSDYVSFYGQLAAANTWTGVNTFSGSFIFTPTNIPIVANVGIINVANSFSVATNNANTSLAVSTGGITGQQVYINAINSDAAASHTWTIDNPSGTDPTFTVAASSTLAIKLQSNGTNWSIIGGAPTINDLPSTTVATGDLLGVWDISAGTTAKDTVANAVSAALTGTPATVAQGGTGRATLTTGNLLVGAGTSQVTFIAPGTGVATALAVNVGSAGAPVVLNGAGGTPSSLTLTNATVDGTNAPGFLIVPQNSQSAAYNIVLADNGKSIDHPSTDANARTYTIPANATIAFPIGSCLSFSNMTSQVVTIAITSDTLNLAGTGTTGSRSLAQWGVATARKVASTVWLISGVGLT